MRIYDFIDAISVTDEIFLTDKIWENAEKIWFIDETLHDEWNAL